MAANSINFFILIFLICVWKFTMEQDKDMRWSGYYRIQSPTSNFKIDPMPTIAQLTAQAPRKLYGRHVCSKTKVVMEPVPEMQSYCKPLYQTYMHKCNNQRNQQFCVNHRIAYILAYRKTEKLVAKKENIFICCPGWTQTHVLSHDCKKALCAKECKNGGICMKPGECLCPKGWVGKTCEKGNETKSEPNKPNEPNKLNNKEYEKEFNEFKERIYQLEKVKGSFEKLKLKVDNMFSMLQTHINNNDIQNNIKPGQVTPTTSTTSVPTSSLESIEEKLNSLSGQIALLEERLADCSCNSKDYDLRSPPPAK